AGGKGGGVLRGLEGDAVLPLLLDDDGGGVRDVRADLRHLQAAVAQERAAEDVRKVGPQDVDVVFALHAGVDLAGEGLHGTQLQHQGGIVAVVDRQRAGGVVQAVGREILRIGLHE